MPGPTPPPRRTSTAAVLALVFAFVFAPLGIVFGLIGRRRTRRTGEGGRGLATAGLLLGTVFTVLGIVAMVTALGVLSRTASAIAGQIESAQQTAGASSSGLVIRKAAIETRVATLLQPALGRAPASVACAGDLVNPRVGSTTRCAITMSDGASAGSTVTVSGVTGTDVALTVQVDALTIFQGELEAMVANNLQRQTGTRPASVSCPGDLANPQAGMTTHCTATNTDGSGTGVTITVTKVAGAQVSINARTDGTS
jgi:peptidyl-prolyl cis-trans isomerase B (cyclophilin B)